MSQPIIAKFGGTCAVCEERYPEGDPIIATAHGWGHETCPEPKPLGAVCTACFTEISLSGECLC